MRSFVFFILVTAICIATLPVQAGDYADAVKADGPVAYWRLNEAAGSTQFQAETGYGTIPLDAFDGDRATTGGVNEDPPEAGVAGVPFSDEPDNKAVFLPNTGPHNHFPCTFDDYLVTNSPIDLSGTGDWTLELWLRHKDGDSTGYPWGSSSTSESVMNNVDLGPNFDSFMIEIEGSGSPDFLPNRFRMRTQYDVNGSTTSTDFKTDENEFPEVDWSAWHHLVFTTNLGTGSIYMDGELVASTPWSGLLTSTGEILAFGQDRCWKGDFDEIALYNKGLTDVQVAAHYDAADLVAETLPGDLNDDGFVGGDDLDIVRSFWGQNVTPGDLLQGDPSGDGFVGGDDLDIVRGNWGTGTPPAAGAVPEPSMLAGLVGLCLAGWLAFGRRDRI